MDLRSGSMRWIRLDQPEAYQGGDDSINHYGDIVKNTNAFCLGSAIYFYYFKVKPALLEFVRSSPISQVQE